MANKTTVALLALLALSGAMANSAPQEGALAPRLRVIQMTGKLQIGTAEFPEGAARESMPFIPSGAQVRVLSGEAWFESDYHAVLRAKEGDAFLFTARAPESEQAGALRIASIGGRPTSVSIYIGGQNFLLRGEGAVLITGADHGLAAVEVESGKVMLAPGSVMKAGESLTFNVEGAAGGGMAAGDRTVVNVPAEAGFQSVPLDMRALRVSHGNGTILEARSIQPGPAYAMAPGRELRAETDLRSAVANIAKAGPAKPPLPANVASPQSWPGMVEAKANGEAPAFWRRLLEGNGILLGCLAAVLAAGGYLLWRESGRK